MNDMSLKDVLENAVRNYGNNVAYSFFNKNKYVEISYSQFYTHVIKLGTYINNLHLKHKRVAIMGKNCYEWALSYMAVACGIGVVVPLDKELTPYEISTYIKKASVDCIIYSNDLEDKIFEATKYLKIKKIAFLNSSKNSLNVNRIIEKDYKPSDIQLYCETKIDPNALGALLFTSGTTKTPKIVMLSQNNIINDVILCINSFPVSSKDKFLSILPLHHMYECTAGFILPIYLGASVHYIQGLRYLKDELIKVNPSIILCVPRVIESFYEIIVKEIKKQKLDKLIKILMNLSNIFGKNNMKMRRMIFSKIHKNFGKNFRFFICGGAAMNIEIAKYMNKLGIVIFEGYGITECSPIVSCNNFEGNKLGSTGKPFSSLDVKINNPDENGIGEIFIKGSIVMLGYYKNHKLNKKVFKNGYFNTEDLGYIDEDGYLYIVGRTKNLILGADGENIFPEEIETLLSNYDIIREVVVSGKASKNSVNLIANIVINDDYVKNNNILKADIPNIIQKIIDETNKKLVYFKRVNSFNIMEHEFEKTSTLKIKR